MERASHSGSDQETLKKCEPALQRGKKGRSNEKILQQWLYKN